MGVAAPVRQAVPVRLLRLGPHHPRLRQGAALRDPWCRRAGPHHHHRRRPFPPGRPGRAARRRRVRLRRLEPCPAVIADLPADVREAFPFSPRWVDAGGSMLHYVDEGPRSTDAVVLLHGNPTWSFLYRNIIPDVVAAGWRVVAPDHLGCGRSDQAALPGQYAVALHAARLLSVLEHAGVRRAVFFLQDWGGPIGMVAGLSKPGLFAGAVLGNTFWGRGSSFHHDPFPWRIMHGPLSGPLLFDRRPVFVDGAALGMPPDLPEVVRKAYRLPWQVNGGAGATLAWPRAIALDDHSPTAPLADAIWDWMATADVPVRWVWGRRRSPPHAGLTSLPAYSWYALARPRGQRDRHGRHLPHLRHPDPDAPPTLPSRPFPARPPARPPRRRGIPDR